MPRPQFALTSPLGDDLRFRAMEHEAELSKLGHTLLSLLSPRADLAPEDLLGTAMTVTARLREGRRFFHGVVTRFGLVGHEGRHFMYRARLCSWPWFLTRTSDCRIFQDQSVPEIVKSVFQDHAVADFDFVARMPAVRPRRRLRPRPGRRGTLRLPGRLHPGRRRLRGGGHPPGGRTGAPRTNTAPTASPYSATL